MVGRTFFQKYCERAEFSATNIKIVGSCFLFSAFRSVSNFSFTWIHVPANYFPSVLTFDHKWPLIYFPLNVSVFHHLSSHHICPQIAFTDKISYFWRVGVIIHTISNHSTKRTLRSFTGWGQPDLDSHASTPHLSPPPQLSPPHTPVPNSFFHRQNHPPLTSRSHRSYDDFKPFNEENTSMFVVGAVFVPSPVWVGKTWIVLFWSHLVPWSNSHSPSVNRAANLIVDCATKSPTLVTWNIMISYLSGIHQKKQ